MKYFLLIVSLFAFLIIAGCVGSNNNDVPPTPQIVYVTVLVTPTHTLYPLATTVVNPSGSLTLNGEVVATIASHMADLQTYRTHIDEKAALGIDTSAAEVKYNEAQRDINSAKSRLSNEYASALSDLSAATAAISGGETALDKAWAENEVSTARVPISKTDAIIGWFKGNGSTANYYKLSPIITMRDVAVSYLSTANDDITSGNYAKARKDAQNASTKGNESYSEALAIQKQLMSG